MNYTEWYELHKYDYENTALDDGIALDLEYDELYGEVNEL